LKVIGKQPSQFRQISQEEKDKIVETINSSGAQIVLIGLGCPRQEVWIYEHRGLITAPMLAVGAAFDFHAGLLSQAPALLQRIGLEWAYRLACEPKRLWKRYALLNPLYVLLVILQILGVRDYKDVAVAPPQDVLRYG
jgi:N-acetylglucosaminyldiphosphoundecaprenol N-acetyl-beta-D-mannosaminyltransferase